MSNQSQIPNPKSQILIVGAGPAGASLAIRLATENFRVVLIEREKFPRQKLCGEFISPEALRHFRELGVLGEMLAVGGDRIAETVFYEPGGRSVSIASRWFAGGGGESALSISRAEMDLRLLERARRLGVEVLEEHTVVDLLSENGAVRGVKVRNKSGETTEIAAGLTIDATGRARVLAKLAERKSRLRITNYEKSQIPNPKSQIQNRIVGFKTHLRHVRLEKGVCEIYFFRGGYGGLSHVEQDLANHCFLIDAATVRKFGGDAGRIVENVVFRNKRAAHTLRDAEPVHDWLAVSVDGYGRRETVPASGLLTAGDASVFIDPFTGSGMLLALECAELLAGIITENRFAPENIEAAYKAKHYRKFHNRLRVCSILRRMTAVPGLMKLGFSVLNLSGKGRELLARSTRRHFLTNESE